MATTREVWKAKFTEGSGYSREQFEEMVDIVCDLEVIEPRYGSPEARDWIRRCFDALERIELDEGLPLLTEEDRYKLARVVNDAPAGLTFEKLSADLKSAVQKVRYPA
jgi:hypothetical protein